ncbi:MAG: hypothetical protein R3F62_10150 [Planctomycetota bacterium]
MTSLFACPDCQEFVRRGEERCPFCHAHLPYVPDAEAPAPPRVDDARVDDDPLLRSVYGAPAFMPRAEVDADDDRLEHSVYGAPAFVPRAQVDDDDRLEHSVYGAPPGLDWTPPSPELLAPPPLPEPLPPLPPDPAPRPSEGAASRSSLNLAAWVGAALALGSLLPHPELTLALAALALGLLGLARSRRLGSVEALPAVFAVVLGGLLSVVGAIQLVQALAPR